MATQVKYQLIFYFLLTYYTVTPSYTSDGQETSHALFDTNLIYS